MASNTQQTEFRRYLRNKRAGKLRKRKLALHGTTPKFSVHTPEADANAPDQARKGD